MMMALGMFVFGLDTLAYQELQFVGPGDDAITLPGVLLAELAGDQASLDELREMADTGKAYALVEGTGKVYGQFVIESLSEGRTLFFRDGAARRIEFTLALKRVDDDRVDPLGAAG